MLQHEAVRTYKLRSTVVAQQGSAHSQYGDGENEYCLSQIIGAGRLQARNPTPCFALHLTC